MRVPSLYFRERQLTIIVSSLKWPLLWDPSLRSHGNKTKISQVGEGRVASFNVISLPELILGVRDASPSVSPHVSLAHCRNPGGAFAAAAVLFCGISVHVVVRFWWLSDLYWLLGLLQANWTNTPAPGIFAGAGVRVVFNQPELVLALFRQCLGDVRGPGKESARGWDTRRAQGTGVENADRGCEVEQRLLWW